MGAVVDHVHEAYRRIAAGPPTVWISLLPEAGAAALAAAVEALVAGGHDLPLAGLTVAVKDNIDVAGTTTTAGCPAFGRRPAVSAGAVARLEAAGAVVVGKTNMDQFATGLVGTRSPYGIVANARDGERVAGGSSSGSAVAVALGQVDLALGTDTAGSGRVPAAFNGVVGVKPTRGLVTMSGVVPACRSFDCVSVFASTVARATRARAVLSAYDDGDPASRPEPRCPLGPTWPAESGWTARAPVRVLGVPDAAALGLAGPERAAFTAAVDRLAALVDRVVPLDLAPFDEAGALLYGGAFVAERHDAVGAFIDAHPGEVDPTVAAIIGAARDIPAHRLAADTRRLAVLRRRVEQVWREVDAVAVPTAPGVPRIADVLADPLGVSGRLGRFTAPVNLLDLCALALPAGTTPDGLPFGISLHGPAFTDDALADLGGRFLGETPPAGPSGRGSGKVGATAKPAAAMSMVVAGAHLAGQPLNHQLTDRGGRLVEVTTTAACYRLYALDTEPPKPGLVRTPAGGAPIEVERWELAPAAFAEFVALVPAPLAIGAVELADGSWATGFTCMPHGLDGARDITATGGWRAHLGAARPG